MSHIDVKCTVWNRYQLPDDFDIEKAKELLKQGASVETVIDELTDGQFGDNGLEYETLHDTECDMTPIQNEGAATIEFYNDEDELIYDNQISQ